MRPLPICQPSFSPMALLFFMNVVAAQCTPGEERDEKIPCPTGIRTQPGTTECTGPILPDWYLKEAEIGSASTGKGGVITIYPSYQISDVERTLINKGLVQHLQLSVNEGNSLRTARLASLLQAVATNQLPLHGAITASATITLGGSYGPFCSGQSTNDCPHMFIPPLSIKLVCLPKLAPMLGVSQ